MTTADTFFVSINRLGEAAGVWHFDGAVAKRIYVPEPMAHASSHLEVSREEDLFSRMSDHLTAVAQTRAPFTFHVLKLRPGQYYQRMSRISVNQIGSAHPRYLSPSATTLTSEIASMRGQLVALMQKAVDICQTVHPSPETLDVYGHEIRNLLLLACTEVEMHWRGILQANGYQPKGFFSTKDYSRLGTDMRLGEYIISLPYYPWLQDFCPFSGWREDDPTQSLPWYRAYNAVKHDREGSFDQGTLGCALNAVVACAVMLIAQFGEQEAFRWRTEFGFFFDVKSVPSWCPSEAYGDPYDPLGLVPEQVQYYANV